MPSFPCHIPYFRPLRPGAGIRLLFLALLLGLAASCGNGREVPRGPKVLGWGEATLGDVKRIVEAQGVVRARDKAFVKVGSRIGGQILKMYVRTGDVVRAGQLLAVVDDRELQAQRRLAEAKLDEARNELSRVTARKGERLEEARAALAADRERQAYVDKLHDRRRILRDQGYIPQSDADASRRDVSTATQVVAGDKAVFERIGKECQRDIESATKAVEAARAQVAQADAYISMTRLESPIDGIVGQVLTQAGEQVVAELDAVKVITVIDPRRLELWIYINEADAAGVKPGMPVRFFLAPRKEQVMAAQVERVSPQPETVDKVLYYPAIAPLPPQAGTLLRPEMNVQCFVLVDDLKGVLSVPNEAIVARGGKRRVYVDDGHGGARAVEPVFGTRGNQRTQVLSGLDPGTRVAVKFAGEAK